jgi:hypothetical protein
MADILFCEVNKGDQAASSPLEKLNDTAVTKYLTVW